MLEFHKIAFLVLHFFYYTLTTFLIMLFRMLLSMQMPISTSKCGQVYDLWQQLELVSVLESDMGDNVNWSTTWLAHI